MFSFLRCCCLNTEIEEKGNEGVLGAILKLPLVENDAYLEDSRLPGAVVVLTDARDAVFSRDLAHAYKSLSISCLSDELLAGKLSTLPFLPNLSHWKFEVHPQGRGGQGPIDFEPHFQAYRHSLRSVQVVLTEAVADHESLPIAQTVDSIARSMRLLRSLDRVIFQVPELPTSLLEDSRQYTYVRYMDLCCDAFAAQELVFHAPNLEIFKLCESDSQSGIGSLNLQSSMKLRKLVVKAHRQVSLHSSNPQLKWVELNLVDHVVGDLSSVLFLTVLTCKNAHAVIGGCRPSLRELRVGDATSDTPQIVDISEVQVLSLDQIKGLVFRQAPNSILEVAELTNVWFTEGQQLLCPKRLRLESFGLPQNITPMSSHINFRAVTHLAIQAPQLDEFLWESVLDGIKDQLVFFATDVLLRAELFPMRSLQILALASSECFRFASICLACPNKTPLSLIALLSDDRNVDRKSVRMLQEEFCETILLPEHTPENHTKSLFRTYAGVTCNLMLQKD